MFGPNSIAHAANLAKLHEASKPTVTGNKYPNRPNNIFIKPNYGNTSIYQNQTSKPILGKAPRTYSATEMADRRAKGLCVFCDEPFTPGHHLKHKKSQLLLMELDDDDSVDEEIEII